MKMLKRRLSGTMLFLVMATLACRFPGLAAQRVVGQNTLNAPFRTITREPLSAFRVSVSDATRSADAIQAAVAELSRQYSQGQIQGLAQFLRSQRPELWEPRFGELVMLVGAQNFEPRRSASRAGGGEITFEYVGWTAADEAQIRNFVDAFYPVAKDIYGAPAFDLTVKIVQDSEIHELLGGIYVVSTHEVHIPPLTGNFPYDSFALAQMILHAFHDAAFLAYDSWEKGFVRAAATLCMMRLGGGFDPMRDPFYLLPLYDLLNQPTLGSPAFFPSTEYTAMFPWRLGMSTAAWLKVAAQYPNFFRDFNSAYYSRWTPDDPATLSGNVPALRQIAGSAAPQVEDKPFGEWYEGQWALDTSVTQGTKLFIYQLPRGSTLLLVVDYYGTDGSAGETPNGGTVVTDYFDYTHTYSLFAQEGYSIAIPSSGADAGQGFLAPTFYNIGGSQRVFVELTIGDIFRTVYFPYSLAGQSGRTNAFFGTIVGDNKGPLSLELNGNLLSQPTAAQGVYFAHVTPPLTDLGTLLARYTNSYGQEVVEKRNVGYGYYVLQVHNAARQQLLTHRFSRGGNGVNLISLPCLPANPSPTATLGIPPDRLLLAEWQPGRQESRYRLYPQVSQLAPGKGYWLKVFQDLDLNVLATPVPADVSYRIELEPGWNLIGNPFPSSVRVADLQFQRARDGPYPFDSAVNLGWISPTIWGFTQATGYAQVDTLGSWSGYWVLVTIEEGVVAFIPPP